MRVRLKADRAPVCPYIARFIKKHPEFADAVDQPTPQVLHWLDAELGPQD